MALTQIKGSNIEDGTVVAADVADNAVTGAKIAMGSDAAGDILTYNGTDYIRLAKGTAAQVLKMNAGATAVEWGTDAGGIAIPGSSVAGDTLYHNGTVYTRLPKGAAAQVLAMNSGATAPEWATASTGGNYYWFQHTYATNSGTQNITKTGFGFAPVAAITFNFLGTLDAQSFGMAYKPVHGGLNGSPAVGGVSWHNVGGGAQVDQSHGSGYFARFPKVGQQDFDFQIYEWGTDGVVIRNIQSGGSTNHQAYSYIMMFG